MPLPRYLKLKCKTDTSVDSKKFRGTCHLWLGFLKVMSTVSCFKPNLPTSRKTAYNNHYTSWLGVSGWAHHAKLLLAKSVVPIPIAIGSGSGGGAPAHTGLRP